MKRYWEAMAITPWDLVDLDRWTERAIQRGATAVVLRLAKPPSVQALWEWARRWEGLPWIVHARWASQPLGYGMHFPAPVMPPPVKPHPDYIYGQSCHSVEEVLRVASWASYVWIGAFFQTPSHPDREGFLPLDMLRVLREALPDLPIVALGGINSDDRVAAVLEAGAWGFASIRYFL